MSQITNLIPASGPGSGTVTSISAGTGITLTPNPITTTGTVALTVPVVIANGGTNATSFTNTDGVVYFDGAKLNTTTVGTALQVLTSNGPGMAPSFQNASGDVTSISGNSGGPQTGAVSIVTANATPKFVGSAGTITLDFAASNNIILGSAPASPGSDNAALGNQALASCTGNSNIAIGSESATSVTSGDSNISIGVASLFSLISGKFNVAVGEDAGMNYVGAESSNICINSDGVASESNTLHIGNGTGTGNQQLKAAYISGIYGKNAGSIANVATVANNDQIGSAVITAGSGISVTPGANTITIASSITQGVVTIDGDAGSMTGSTVTISGGTTGLSTTASGATMSLTGTLGIANGGTDATSFTQSNGIVTYNGTRLVNYTGPRISSAGINTNTSQPAFNVYVGSAQSNVTGDGTGPVTVQYNTVVFDNTSSFNTGTYSWVAPVSGRYMLGYSMYLNGLTSSHTLMANTLTTTGGSYQVQTNPYAFVGGGTSNYIQPYSAFVNMSAGDTAYVTVQVYNGTKVVNIQSGAPYCFFWGYLVC